MSKAYHLKNLLNAKNISYDEFVQELPISKTGLSGIINHQRWPKRQRQNVAKLRDEIEARLESEGFSQKEIATCWQLQGNQYINSQNHKPKARRPVMLKSAILEKLELTKDPFSSEIEELEDIYMTPQHKNVLDIMLDAARHNKFLFVIGPIGSGKLMLKLIFKYKLESQGRTFISEPNIIDKHKCLPSSIIDSLINDLHLHADPLTEKFKFTKTPLEQKSRMVKAILEHVTKMKKKKCNLIVDEGHLLPTDTIKSMKNFHELLDGFKRMLSIIIFGQPELGVRLEKDSTIREVAERGHVAYLRPIPNLVVQYIRHKISRASGDANKIFTESAYRAIQRTLIEATPQEINNIVSR
ncbi:AAA family ATPase, partial [candidate division KSB1 bacterium]|nr:AAA family ATPase [candidate division KSB1 bacterium]NIR72062.1 AAA family ATPase [candidate division KSB1 bacterium]NIS25713.1 AAA family ATPase [candidate division KSB1 bacterium]NIT72572.1 AAA family ATPase [candidate division KSB1 bacterium]NIU26398.1 AAA family ATPase [candidate division KSB1 bacterium]